MNNIQKAYESLLALQGKNKFEKMLGTAAILTEQLMRDHIRPIIVGGLSMEIYTLNGYTTQDVDFVLNGSEKAAEVLAALHFTKLGKDWIHPELGITIEIPSNHLEGDYEKITELAVGSYKVFVIGIEDLIIDRLRSAVHWMSGVDREWGYRLLLMYIDQLDLPYLRSCFQHPKEEEEFAQWFHQAECERDRIGE